MKTHRTKKPSSETGVPVEAAPKRKRYTPLSGVPSEDGYITEMQMAFINNLVEHRMGQTAAAAAAGYRVPKQSAYDILQQPKIKKEIARRRAEYAQVSGITRKKVIDGFLEAVEMAKLISEPFALIGAWREIGKMCGLYEATKTKIEVSVGGKVLLEKMSTMSDEELLKLAESDPDIIEGEFHEVENDGDLDRDQGHDRPE